jgi:hypothetical protein
MAVEMEDLGLAFKKTVDKNRLTRVNIRGCKLLERLYDRFTEL